MVWTLLTSLTDRCRRRAQGQLPVPKTNDSRRSATVTKIPIGARPIGMKVSPDRKRTYVAYASGIAVVDRAAKTVVDRITLPPEARPHSIAISLDGKRIYVTSYLPTTAQVYVVDVTAKTVIATIPIGGFPSGIATTPDGTQVWATSLSSGNITVIDTLTNARVLVISGISAAWGVRFNPTGTRAYVTSSENVGGSLRVIDTASTKRSCGFRPATTRETSVLRQAGGTSS